MVRKITTKGLKKNLGRRAYVNWNGSKIEGVLIYDTHSAEIRVHTKTFNYPIRNNTDIDIDSYRYNPGKHILRTYRVSISS